MLDFRLTFLKRSRRSAPRFHPSDLCLERPDEKLVFDFGTPSKWRLEVFASSSGSADDLGDRARLTEDKDLALYIGYARSGSGRPIRSLQDFDPAAAGSYGGDFLFVRLDSSGRVELCKSPVCSAMLYFADGKDEQVLASRASLALLSDDPPRTSPDFLRWTATYGIGCNSASIFEGVSHVQINQSIVANENGIHLTAPDFRFLQDDRLRKLFREDRKRYWDDAFETLLEAASAVNFTDAPIEFPLSGGKDSRLLLALTRRCAANDREFRVFTNGPSQSPEVRAAALVCDALGLQHTQHDNTGAETVKPPSINDRLAEHAHITEGEMSPIDLTWGFRKRSTVQPHGQEGGLRNMAPRDDITDRDSLWSWLSMHVGYGDRCGILKGGQAGKSLAELDVFIDTALELDIPPGEIPSLHRIIYRMGRWVARTWVFNNNRGFAPYPFVDFDVIKYTFNSGVPSRLGEEFHFEMLKRLDKRLVELPFAEQSWPEKTVARSELSPATPLRWPDDQYRTRALPRHDALIRHFDGLKRFLMTHDGNATSKIIDRDRFSRVELSDLHESSYQCFWQIVQVALFERVSDISMLGPGLSATDLGLPNFD